MYSDSVATALGGLAFLYAVLGIAVLVAYVMLVAWLVRIAREKGADMSNGALWFIGLFTTPVALGIAVAALPDRGQKQEAAHEPGVERGEPVPDYPVIELGSYVQDGSSSSPIEWYVLGKRDNGETLLLSKDCLAAKIYHGKCEPITWAACDLRSWLNGEFFEDAFSAEERERIVLSHLKNGDNPSYHTPGGVDTDDKVFLLSLQEIEKYFGVTAGSSDTNLIAYPTEHAVSQGDLARGDNPCRWWLRSPGTGTGFAAGIGTGGGVGAYGYSVDSGLVAVRPACWVKLES